VVSQGERVMGKLWVKVMGEKKVKVMGEKKSESYG
jgi:hypothetical protein